MKFKGFARCALLIATLAVMLCAMTGVGAAALKEEIVFCQGNDLTTMDPHIGIQERTCALNNNMFDSLFKMDVDGRIVPDLAESYKWIDDLTLEIKFKGGVKFHNGKDMTAEDVAFSIDRIAERGSLFTKTEYDRTEIVDPTTVRIHLKVPARMLINMLSVPYAAMISKEHFESDPEKFATNPVGTGPYKLKEFREGDYYTLERFDDYREGPAKTKFITLRIVPETAQRIILLETGEVDVAYDIPPSSIARIKDNADLKVLTNESMKVTHLAINCSSEGPLKDPRLRRAIQAAVDKKLIIDSFIYGYGTLANSPVPTSAKEYEVLEEQGYDPERAKALLAEGGYPNGFEMTMWTDASQTNTEISQAVQNMLAQVGIKLEIVVQDSNTIFSRLKAGDDFGMILDFFNLVAAHGEHALKRLFISTSSSNYSRFRSPEYDAAFAEYAPLADGPERDAKRAVLVKMLREQMPLVNLYNETKVVGARASLEGFEVSRIGSHEYHNATVEE